MNRRLYKAFLAATLAALPAAAAIQQPVKVKTGLVAGAAASDSSITVFKGIPYAAPPVGDLRWRAPRAAAAWQGVRKADQFSASCVQNIVTERKPWTFEFMAHGDISEDCLYLNIWTPAKSSAEKTAGVSVDVRRRQRGRQRFRSGLRWREPGQEGPRGRHD